MVTYLLIAAAGLALWLGWTNLALHRSRKALQDKLQGDFDTERQIKRTEIHRGKALSSTILSALVEAVIAIDHQSRVRLANPAAERLFSIRFEDVEGKPFLEVLRHSALTPMITQTLSEGVICSKEIVVNTPDERFLQAQTRPVEFGSQEKGVLVALYDITDIRKLEKIRQEFLANASHELKTPLTSIKGYVETLLNGALEDPKHNRSFLETIDEQTHRLMRLIEDLLDLSAIEGRKTAYRFEPVALKPIVERLLLALHPQAGAKDVALTHSIPDDCPAVRADAEKVAQILMNLMENAIKFNRPGGHVTVHAQGQGDHVAIQISDTGPGIPAEDLPRVFERFYRGDKSHSNAVPGTGLGLAIVKHLVEAHQGKATVESTLGEGSTFRVFLPKASGNTRV